MTLYKSWCTGTLKKTKKKTLRAYAEKKGSRAKVLAQLGETVKAHYDHTDRIADDVARLGYAKAAEILRALLPQSPRARSGDLGEILASELVEEEIGFRVPVRRMRFKDGREVAMRGDDFIGVGYDDKDKLWLLKGESKSRAALGKTTIAEAREALNRHDGRCTPNSLLFIANRLLDSADTADQELGRTLRDEVGVKALPAQRIDHMLFALSGNDAGDKLESDLENAGDERNQHVASLRIEDHQDFIAAVYEEAMNLGDK
ncbi:Hachiman antiphage defense system protein HamA [Phenylobacterium sp.]|uniref:Hachiman antiphage defense system protein HamA n=1 Tax=Phenylobacterium sp. TaxID=1871053 RepID=UPI00286B2CA6|nr:Hachiman antiphage defense system protein HamA [Phenylobacterium sp.]